MDVGEGGELGGFSPFFVEALGLLGAQSTSLLLEQETALMPPTLF